MISTSWTTDWIIIPGDLFGKEGNQEGIVLHCFTSIKILRAIIAIHQNNQFPNSGCAYLENCFWKPIMSQCTKQMLSHFENTSEIWSANASLTFFRNYVAISLYFLHTKTGGSMMLSLPCLLAAWTYIRTCVQYKQCKTTTTWNSIPTMHTSDDPSLKKKKNSTKQTSIINILNKSELLKKIKVIPERRREVRPLAYL